AGASPAAVPPARPPAGASPAALPVRTSPPAPAAADQQPEVSEISEKTGEPKPLLVPEASTLASATTRSKRAHRRWWTTGAAAAVILIAVGVAVARPLFGGATPQGDIAVAADNAAGAPPAEWNAPDPANVPTKAGAVPSPSVSGSASVPAVPPGAPTTVP